MKKINKILTLIICFGFVFIFSACDGFLWLKGGNNGGGGTTVNYTVAAEAFRGTYTIYNEGLPANVKSNLGPGTAPITYVDKHDVALFDYDLVTKTDGNITYNNKSIIYTARVAAGDLGIVTTNTEEYEVFGKQFDGGDVFNITPTALTDFASSLILTNGTTKNLLAIKNPLTTNTTFTFDIGSIAGGTTEARELTLNATQNNYKLKGTIYLKFFKENTTTDSYSYCLAWCNYTVVSPNNKQIAYMRQSVMLKK